MYPHVIPARYALLGEELEIIENVEISIDQTGKIVAIEEVNNINNQVLLIPGFYNAHTHTGDSGLYGQLPKGASLEELVGDNSIKQNYLDTLTEKKLADTINKFISTGNENSVTLYTDFREDGLTGVLPYRNTPVADNISRINHWKEPLMPYVSVLSRPDGLNDAKKLSKDFGLGIRDIYYYPIDEMMEMVGYYKSNDKPVQIHVAEDPVKMRSWADETGETDLTWAVKNLKPELLVHTNYGEEADYQVMKDHDMPLAICPTSNRITNTPRVKMELLEEMDFPHKLINMGSDNGMFLENNPAHELEILATHTHYNHRELLQIGMIPHGVSSVEHLSCIEKGKQFRGTKVRLDQNLRNHQQIYELLTN